MPEQEKLVLFICTFIISNTYIWFNFKNLIPLSKNSFNQFRFKLIYIALFTPFQSGFSAYSHKRIGNYQSTRLRATFPRQDNSGMGRGVPFPTNLNATLCNPTKDYINSSKRAVSAKDTECWRVKKLGRRSRWSKLLRAPSSPSFFCSCWRSPNARSNPCSASR